MLFQVHILTAFFGRVLVVPSLKQEFLLLEVHILAIFFNCVLIAPSSCSNVVLLDLVLVAPISCLSVVFHGFVFLFQARVLGIQSSKFFENLFILLLVL